MFYKLSNTANLQDIEDVFDANFKYPHLYKKAHLINGLSEKSLPVITMAEPDHINYAIWGLLPQNFKEGWESFQNLTNTLNFSIDGIDELEWVNSLLAKQRCAIIVTGFFTSYIYKGEVYPFYVYEKNHRPFALAGVYSKLSDGFLSVGIITSSLENELRDVHNLCNEFPVALSTSHHKEWLAKNNNFSKYGINSLEKLELKAHAISKEFYKNEIVFDDILEPAHYSNLPILSLK